MAITFAQVSTTGLVPNTTGLGLGLAQQSPEIIYITTTDALATVLVTGYLTSAVQKFQLTLNNYQMALVYVTDNGGENVWLSVAVTTSSGANVYSLVARAADGAVATPTVANQITYSTDTIGSLASAGLATALFNLGNITAGKSGTAGSLFSFPAGATSGKLGLTAVTNSGGNFNTTISNAASVGQTQVVSIPDGGNATSNFIISKSAGTQHITTGALQVDAGAISSGISTGGFVGLVKAYSTTATNGFIAIQGANNGSGNFGTTLSNQTTQAQAQVLTFPDVGAATGNVLAAGAALVSGNLVQASGTSGAVVDSGITAASVASSVVVQTATVTLTQANIQAAYGAPVVLIAAPAAGKAIVILNAQIYTNFQTAAFANGGVTIVQYDTTIHGAGTNALSATIPAAEVTAASSQIYSLVGQTAGALTGVTAKGIYWSNATGAFTAGNAASTIVVTLSYMVLTATV